MTDASPSPCSPASPPSTASARTRCCSASPATTSRSSATSAASCARTTASSASRSTPRSTSCRRPTSSCSPAASAPATLVHDERVLDWVRRAHETTTFTTSVCTGSLVLAAAGLLDGLTATTHWAAMDVLGEATARSPTGERVVEHLDRRIITAAGVSSGIDMALRLVELLVDRTAAEAAQLMIEYDPQPPFDAGAVDKAGDDVIARVIEYAAVPLLTHPSVRGHRVLSADAAQPALGWPPTLGWDGQTAVAQNVSPRALLASVATSTSSPSPYERAEHPAHHAAVDGADHRVVGGDGAERAVVVDDPQPVGVPAPAAMWAAKPCAVRASATACIAERSERCPAASASPVSPAAIARPYVGADLLGHRLGLVVAAGGRAPGRAGPARGRRCAPGRRRRTPCVATAT